jgi:HPt (histidine-containing phosphotransfer) domain-containing protein
MTTSPQDPIDAAVWSELLDLAGADAPMMIAELIDSFVDDAEHQLEGMRSAAMRGDREALRRCAHALRSPSASLGATLLAELCRQLEQSILECDDKGQRMNNIDAIRTECRKVLASLNKRHPGHAHE